MPEPSPGLTLIQAAQALHRSERCIRRWIATGKLKAEKVSGPTGAEWRINAEDVAALGDDLPHPAAPLPHPTGQAGEDLPHPAAPSVGAELTEEVHLIETRLARIEGALTGAWLTDLAAKLDALEEENAQLRREVIQAQHEAQVLAQRQAEEAHRREEELLAELRAIREQLGKPPWWKRWWSGRRE